MSQLTMEKFNLGRLLVYDLETSRLEDPGVVQLGVVHFLDGKPERKVVHLVNPGHPIDPGATKIHGITDEMVKDCPTFEQLAPALYTDLETGGVLSVSYNGRRFDDPALKKHFKACGIDWQPPQIDIFDFVQWNLRHNKNRKLVDMAQMFGVDITKAHDAGADALAAGQVMFKMIEAKYIPEDPREALAKAAEIGPHIDQEFDVWKWHLYSREDGVIRVGFGKWCGTPLGDVDPSFLMWFFGKNGTDSIPPDVLDKYRRRIKGESHFVVSKDPLLKPLAREHVSIGPIAPADRTQFTPAMLPQLPKTAAFLYKFFGDKDIPFCLVDIIRDVQGKGQIIVQVSQRLPAADAQRLSDELWRAFMMEVGLEANGEWVRGDKVFYIEIEQPPDEQTGSVNATIANQPPPAAAPLHVIDSPADAAKLYGEGSVQHADMQDMEKAGLIGKPAEPSRHGNLSARDVGITDREMFDASIVGIRGASGKIELLLDPGASQQERERAEFLAQRIAGQSSRIESCEVVNAAPLRFQPGAIVKRECDEHFMVIETRSAMVANCLWIDERDRPQRAPFNIAELQEQDPAKMLRDAVGRILPRDLAPGEQLAQAPLPPGVALAESGAPAPIDPLAELQGEWMKPAAAQQIVATGMPCATFDGVPMPNDSLTLQQMAERAPLVAVDPKVPKEFITLTMGVGPELPVFSVVTRSMRDLPTGNLVGYVMAKDEAHAEQLMSERKREPLNAFAARRMTEEEVATIQIPLGLGGDETIELAKLVATRRGAGGLGMGVICLRTAAEGATQNDPPLQAAPTDQAQPIEQQPAPVDAEAVPQ